MKLSEKSQNRICIPIFAKVSCLSKLIIVIINHF